MSWSNTGSSDAVASITSGAQRGATDSLGCALGGDGVSTTIVAGDADADDHGRRSRRRRTRGNDRTDHREPHEPRLHGAETRRSLRSCRTQRAVAHTPRMTRPPLLDEAQRRFVAETRRAILATTAPDNRPRLVPVCFVLGPDDDAMGRLILYTPLDEKPKQDVGPARPRPGTGPPRPAAGDARSSIAGTRTGRASPGSASTEPASSWSPSPARSRSTRRRSFRFARSTRSTSRRRSTPAR